MQLFRRHQADNQQNDAHPKPQTASSITVEQSTSAIHPTPVPFSEPLDCELWDRLQLRGIAGYDGDPAAVTPYTDSRAPSPYDGDEPPKYVLSLRPRDYSTSNSCLSYLETIQLPSVQVKYDFVTTSFNSMCVAPVFGHGSGAKYHITVNMDCFAPSSHITVVRRGGTDLGALVAQFE